MNDLQDDPILDEEVARLTDALLSDQAFSSVSGEAEALMRVARDLNTLIAPRTRLVPEAQARLRAPVEAAWAERAPLVVAPKRRVTSLLILGTIAAAIVLMVLIIPPDAVVQLPLSATSMPSSGAAAEVSLRVVALASGVVLLVGWAIWKRRPGR